MKVTLYHNPRCSKSRAALALLADRGADVEVVEYLATPLSRAALAALLRKLDTPAIAMVRTDEPDFRPYAGRALSDDEVLDALAANPRLLQRPIAEVGPHARIGRPPERVLELLP
jgi:arsenate reductase